MQRISTMKEKEICEIQRLEIPRLLIESLLIFLIVAIITRGDISMLWSFLTEHSLAAFMNYMLILSILSVSVFFRKKVFVRSLISLFIILLSLVSAIVNFYRNMPLQIYDFISYKEAISVANTFMGTKNIVIISCVLVLLVISMVVVYIKSKKYKRIGSIYNIVFFVVIVLVFSLSSTFLRKNKIIEPMNWDIKGSYEQNGFMYSLYDSFILSFRKKPDGYSEEAVYKIRQEIDNKEREDRRVISKNTPQVVYIQLEAFMDPTRIEGIEFEKDPIPNIRKLMKNHTSGLVNVPVTGGGTARTEYEVLSGFSFDYLNPGEIPYETFLSNKESISMATHFNSMGYSTTSMHNFYYRFYNRGVGYKNLGFNQFIPFETMTSVEYNPKYWPKDFVLNKYIMSKINSGSKNLVFTVTVQGHSKYPTEKMNIDMPIKIKKSKYSKEETNQIQYYANQMYETDRDMGELVDMINKSKKPTIIAMYGDHLPALEVFSKRLSKLDLFDSLFVIYDNFGAEKQTVPKNFQAYQLSTMVDKMAGIKYSPIEKLHAYLMEDKDYQKKLSMIQYDVLFGKKYFLKDSEMPKSEGYSVGVNNFLINKVEKKGNNYNITGSGFNRFTFVYIDGKKQDMVYNTEYNIDTKATAGKKLQLKLVDEYGKVIKESNIVDIPK